MDYLGISPGQLEEAGGYWTAREISQQPATWMKVQRIAESGSAALTAFLEPLLKRKEMRIVLTGAGTSAFVGECLAPALIRRTGLRVDAVATTDIVASPRTWLPEATPTLLVSFARSGNSPESVAALVLAEQAVRECHHLIVTCNKEGALYRQAQSMRNSHVILLPEEANDRGFAMTSSFSGMLLAAALAFDLLDSDAHAPVKLARWADETLAALIDSIETLARTGFERVVYLGSNELRGLAREAALKMLELSDGRIVAVAETPLGFRHGPKTIINRKTLVVLLHCHDPYTRRYETDLLNELRSDGIAGRIIALTGDAIRGSRHPDDLVLPGVAAASDLRLCFPYAVFVQTLAFFQSLRLALRPDQPNAAGTVNRVVQGVSIYPWDGSR
jgi:tagatose-6-phosphate ketose/aldose isomerase